MARACLGLGGNVGDTRAYLTQAIEKLGALGTVAAVSSLYKTEPVGGISQPNFLNIAVALDTELSPEALLAAVQHIEHELGRTPSVRNGPREIDIDILLYDDTVVDTDALTIPHPRLAERAFALVPLAEVAPRTVHPVLREPVSMLASELRDVHAYEQLPPENGFPVGLLH